MSYTVTLGTSSLEMTLDPTANNTVELISKASIRGAKIIKRGILQLTLQKSHSDDSNNTRNSGRDLVLNIDLTDISNQGTWSPGTLASDKVALVDFNTWLVSSSGGGGAGDASAANQVTGNNSLNTIANNSTTSNVNESISLGNLSNIDTSTTAIATNGKISTINSTAITLAISGVYTGTSEDVTQYGYINVAVISDVASATDGLSIQQSSNGTNWDISDNYTIPSGTAKVFSVGRSGKFFRVVYTNGGVIQASFRLQSIFTKGSVKPSSVRPQDGRTNDNDMEENLAYNMLYNGTSWDRTLKGQQTMANSQATTIASNQTPLNVIPTSSSTAAAAGIKGTFTAYGYQRMTLEPKLVFSDPFDGVVVDVTNNWTQSGTVTQTGGLASIGNVTTTTTVNNLVSKPTFPPSGLNFLVNAFVASFEASPLSTTNVNRFVGFGIHTGTPSVSVPVTDGVGFEWDAATSKLYAAVWQNSVRSASSIDLTASVTSASTRYAVVFRSDLAIFYINGTEIPVAVISFVTPNTQILPVRAQTVIGGSAPSVTPNMQIGAIVVGDTGGNASQIADGTYPFRKGKISALGELSITSSGLPTALGQTTMAASQPVVIASNQSNLPTQSQDFITSGNITTQNLNATGVGTAGSFVGFTNLTGMGTLLIQVTGVYTGNLQMQTSLDGTNWFLSNVTEGYRLVDGVQLIQISSGATGLFRLNINGAKYTRVVGTTAITGTAAIVIEATSSQGLITGNVSLSGVSGQGALLGQIASASSLPVVMANEQVQDLFITGQSAQSAAGNNIFLAVAGVGSTDTLSVPISYRSFYTQIIGSAGIASGAIIFEGSNDNGTFNPLTVYDDAAVLGAPINTAQNIAASTNRFFSGKTTYRYIRCRISTVFSGGTVQAITRFVKVDYIPRILTVAQPTAANLATTATIASGTVTTVSTVTNVATIGTSVTPGTAATNLGKARNAATGATDTGVGMLALRNDALTTFGTTGNYNTPITDKYGSLIVKQQYLQKTTYSLAFTVTLATTPTDVFQIIGSASKSVMIQKINISGSQTTGGTATVSISKRSAANTGGTSSASTMVPHDAADAAATAVGAIYTANPTPGTAVGNIRVFNLPLAAVTGTTNNIVQLDFGERGKPIVLTGTSQALAINLGGATLTGGVLNVWIEFTEE